MNCIGGQRTNYKRKECKMEDSKCGFCVLRVIVPGIPGKKAWFPGDTLTGFIEITSPEFNIVDLRVTLEGLSQWIK